MPRESGMSLGHRETLFPHLREGLLSVLFLLDLRHRKAQKGCQNCWIHVKKVAKGCCPPCPQPPVGERRAWICHHKNPLEGKSQVELDMDFAFCWETKELHGGLNHVS